MTVLSRLAATGIERARSAKPVSWLTIVGVLLLPALVGGVLFAALYDPTERLDNMTAAIVNNDEPVTIQDQPTPLGRQLAAGLVEGSDDAASNLTWVLSNDDDAAEGLEDGTYQAVITIPENFSAAATSSGQRLSGEDVEPEQATIEVVTAPDARLADEAITSQIASVATTTMGQTLSQATLSNVLIGFTTLGEQLGEAADGATQLADGATAAQDGATQLADGATQLGTGAGQLADGAGQLAGGAGGVAGGALELANGVAGIADGASGLADGAAQLSQGANGLADGIDGLALGISGDGTAENPGLVGGANNLASAAERIGTGLSGDGTRDNPGLAPSLRQVADRAAPIGTGLRAAADSIDQNGLVPADTVTSARTLADDLAALSADCVADGGEAAFCDRLSGYATDAAAASGVIAGLAETPTAEITTPLREAADLTTQFGRLASGAEALAVGVSGDGTAQNPGLAQGLRSYAAGVAEVGDGAAQLAGGARDLADGAGELSGGASQLATGAGQAADGATALSDGTSQLASGANGVATGADQLSSGAGELATGTTELGDGIGELADGTQTLAGGLGQATEEIPSYTEREADDLAAVVSDPVTASSAGVALFGAAAIPLLAAVVLWFGGLATFVVMRSVTARALTSRRASVTLAGGALLPAAIVGAVQGVLVGVVVQMVNDYEVGTAAAMVALCALIGVAFAAVHQALTAVFGGAGRWIGALVGAMALATGIISTLPGWLADLSGILPTSPAYRALLGTVTDAGGAGAAVTALLLWAVLAFAATTIAVARKRSASSKLLLESAAV
ncbi:YhgE/Pip family protein [Microbacterium sp. JZ31]|uniref:YhgE/Pip family protein n=1 Tax=Microbacterium sp. JZ31 TaxID=1906274 RepID=UPI001933B2F2|nr:YhgE/Pip family protein [Microbacterium sp. JZ31]